MMKSVTLSENEHVIRPMAAVRKRPVSIRIPTPTIYLDQEEKQQRQQRSSSPHHGQLSQLASTRAIADGFRRFTNQSRLRLQHIASPLISPLTNDQFGSITESEARWYLGLPVALRSRLFSHEEQVMLASKCEALLYDVARTSSSAFFAAGGCPNWNLNQLDGRRPYGRTHTRTTSDSTAGSTEHAGNRYSCVSDNVGHNACSRSSSTAIPGLMDDSLQQVQQRRSSLPTAAFVNLPSPKSFFNSSSPFASPNRPAFSTRSASVSSTSSSSCVPGLSTSATATPASGTRSVTPEPVLASRAAYYRDPAARRKMRLFLTSPTRFDEVVAYGYPLSPTSTSAEPASEYPFSSDTKAAQTGSPNQYHPSASSSCSSSTRSSTVDHDPVFDSDPSIGRHQSAVLMGREDAESVTTAETIGESRQWVRKLPRHSPVSSSPDRREWTLRLTLTRPELRDPELLRWTGELKDEEVASDVSLEAPCLAGLGDRLREVARREERSESSRGHHVYYDKEGQGVHEKDECVRMEDQIFPEGFLKMNYSTPRDSVIGEPSMVSITKVGFGDGYVNSIANCLNAPIERYGYALEDDADERQDDSLEADEYVDDIVIHRPLTPIGRDPLALEALPPPEEDASGMNGVFAVSDRKHRKSSGWPWRAWW